MRYYLDWHVNHWLDAENGHVTARRTIRHTSTSVYLFWYEAHTILNPKLNYMCEVLRSARQHPRLR